MSNKWLILSWSYEINDYIDWFCPKITTVDVWNFEFKMGFF